MWPHGWSGALRARAICAQPYLFIWHAWNALWSWFFFAWHLGALAFIDILVLWALIVATLISFWRINRLAGALLAPYLLWVSFAVALNYVTWQLNPQLLG